MGIDSALKSLLETGILGVMLVITISAIIFLYKENQKEKADRLADLKQYTNEDRLFIAQIKEMLANVLELNKSTLENVLKLLKGK